MPKEERVNHPSHYQTGGGIEVIDVIRHYTCDIANALKYLMRAGRKQEADMTDREKEIEDLRKALWYIEDYRQHCVTESVGKSTARLHRSTTEVEVALLLNKYTDGRIGSITDVAGACGEPVREAVALLMQVGVIYDGEVLVPQDWQTDLQVATTAIQDRILTLEAEVNKQRV